MNLERIVPESDNYLGLAHHSAVVEQARRAVERFGSAMLGSRLFTGTTDTHSHWEGTGDWFDALGTEPGMGG